MCIRDSPKITEIQVELKNEEDADLAEYLSRVASDDTYTAIIEMCIRDRYLAPAKPMTRSLNRDRLPSPLSPLPAAWATMAITI